MEIPEPEFKATYCQSLIANSIKTHVDAVLKKEVLYPVSFKVRNNIMRALYPFMWDGIRVGVHSAAYLSISDNDRYVS